jgi:hypothetical protein
MNSFQPYQPNTTGQLIIGGIFYLFLAMATFLSMATIYVLLKRSKERTLAFFVCVIYIIVFMAIVGQGINSLNKLS